MKVKTTVLIVVLGIQVAFSQSQNMTITTQKISGNEVNWEATLSLTIPAAARSGLVLEMPRAVRMIPIAVSLNERNLWLQNGMEPSGIDSVVVWYTENQSISFLFNSGQVAAGERLQIQTMTSRIGKPAPAESVIQLRLYTGNETEGEIADSVALPLEWVEQRP